MMSINAAIDIYIDNYVCFDWCVYTSDSDQAIIHTCTTLVADDLYRFVIFFSTCLIMLQKRVLACSILA